MKGSGLTKAGEYFSIWTDFVGSHKKFFIPSLIGPFLEMTLIPQTGSVVYYTLTLSLPSSKTAFSQPCKENCITEGSESW